MGRDGIYPLFYSLAMKQERLKLKENVWFGHKQGCTGLEKTEAQHHGRPLFLLWDAILYLWETFRTRGLGIFWKQHMGLNLFVLGKRLSSPCNGRISRSHCLWGGYGQSGLASSGRWEGWPEVPEHMLLRKKNWRLMGTASLKLFG